MGVVHHPRYLIYFEIARTRFMDDLGVRYSDVMRAGTHLAVIEAGARYLRPARYQEELVVTTRCTAVSGTRVMLTYEVRRDGELLATGHSRLASIHPDGRPRRMPTELRSVFERVLAQERTAPGRPTEHQ